MHACGELLGNLRVYAGTTIVCELLVLVLFSASAFAGSDKYEALEQLGGEGLVSAPLHFSLTQVALSLVLVRLYTAWLAHGLHKLREDLTYVVLPESPKARASEAKRAAAERQHLARSVLVPAWEPPCEQAGGSSASPEARPWWQVWLHGGRGRALLCAAISFALVLTAAGTGLWRAHEQEVREARSTCRTATRGLDFCVQKTYLGVFEVVSDFEHCCHACDVKPDCQAWSFQGGTGTDGGKCWQMHFEQAPCSKLPSHQDCRCYTSADRVGGYRPRIGDIAAA